MKFIHPFFISKNRQYVIEDEFLFIKILKKSKHSVETKNLSINWGEVNVLNQLNFKLNDGEKLAIVGPSGSGKSTILKILAGLILPPKVN